MRYDRSIAISDRLRRLVRLIRTGNFSSPALAQKLAVSAQTIYRDIDFLRVQGYVIESVRRSGGWAYQLLAEPAKTPHGKDSGK
jgi:predicted DNA-binding transcriptional regulator YafY